MIIMADTFEKFKSSVNKGITTISVKATSSLEKSKLKTQIDSHNGEIERLYRKIGETAYLLWDNDAPDFRALNEMFDKVKARKTEIERLNAECAAIDERDNQIIANADNPPAPTFTCPGCGTKYDTKINFCRSCGTKMP